MSATAVLPVKRFAAAKQRLAGGVDEPRRLGLIEAMLEDVLEAVARTRAIERTIVVTSEPRAAELALAAGCEVVPDADAPGHSEAALAGIARAEASGAERVLLLPGDCPLIEPREVEHLLTAVPHSFVAVVPDRHGSGTNALLLAPPGAIRPSFGEGSRERHVAAAREAGIPFAVEELHSLALDLDTPADIIALTRALGAGDGRARRTARALGL